MSHTYKLRLLGWVKFPNDTKSHKGIIESITFTKRSEVHNTFSVIVDYKIKIGNRVYNSRIDNVAIKPVNLSKTTIYRLLNKCDFGYSIFNHIFRVSSIKT